MHCFICKKPFKFLNIMVDHFKKEHNLLYNSNYRCFDSSCLQLFDNLFRYKRHVAKHIVNNSEKLNDNCVPNELLRNVNETASSFSVESQNAECNMVDQQQNIFDIAKYFEELNQNIVAFSLLLHSHNNFTRKDVYEVQKSVDDS